jgi:hypothetical protein
VQNFKVTHMIADWMQSGDVITARRFGRKSRQTYVIDRLHNTEVITGATAVDAHREHSGRPSEYMLLVTDSIRFQPRNYR